MFNHITYSNRLGLEIPAVRRLNISNTWITDASHLSLGPVQDTGGLNVAKIWPELERQWS